LLGRVKRSMPLIRHASFFILKKKSTFDFRKNGK